MNVLVDHQIFLLQRYGGISRYHANINYHVNALKSGSKLTIKTLGSSSAYVTNNCSFLKILNSRRTMSILQSINKKAIQFNLKKFDVFHPTYYDPYFLSLKDLPPFVVTIHDMIPEMFYAKKMAWLVKSKKMILSRAAAIIAISEATKTEMLRMVDVNPDLVHVIHHGFPVDFENSKILNKKGNIENEKPYILFVGLRGLYKNFPFFVKSASDFMKKNDIFLKVIGPMASLEEVQMLRKLGIEHLVSFENQVAEKELYNYYNKALCFTFPSVAEGFGMPILEAFVAKCPVLCSNIPVFREVAGEAALYFEQDSQSINNALERILQSSGLRNYLADLGYNRIKKFHWKEKAEETLKVYLSVLGKSNNQ